MTHPNQNTNRVAKLACALTVLLLTLPLALHAVEFSFEAPAGPQFTEAEKIAQREAGARVVPMVLETFRTGVDSVRIPPGNYRFGKERWDRDGVVYPLEFVDLQRDDAHPFTIDATGATFWFDLPDDQAPTCHFCVGFKNCRNIIFKGATIDRATRGHIEGRITQFDFDGNRIELQLSPGITVPATFSGKLEQRVIPFKADGTFCVPLYALQRGGIHLKYKHISQPTADGRCWVTMQTPKLLDTIRATGVLRVGDGLSCIYTVTSSLELIRSGKLTMDGIRVYAAKAWGAERGGFGAHVWKNCYFGPRPGTSQWQGGEGFMFNATRHGTTLDNVTICHTTDDTANFHGYWSVVESVTGKRVTFRPNKVTHRDLAIGDAVIFFDKNTGTELSRAKLTGIDGDTVTLDQPADTFANAIAEWPDHECAGWLVQNCDWHDNYQRLLIQSGPGTVRNCRFTRWGSTVELNSVLNYIEGGVPRDIHIENNTFTDVAISEHTHCAPPFGNITITGNTFNWPAEKAIALKHVEGANVASNRFAVATPPVRVVDLNLGETQAIELASGSQARVKLVALDERRDILRQAVREARVTVEVNGTSLVLTSANYNLPVTVAGVQIDCPITRGYTAESSKANVWALEKDARFRLWPAGSPWMDAGAFGYPAKQRWFASDTQMANEPVFVDGGEIPGNRKIYYHYGLDFGGAEGLVEVVAATDGLVVSAVNVTLPAHTNSPAKGRYDVIYIVDAHDWYYRYSHLKTIDVKPGDRVRRGQRLGLLGKEGGSGGWSHLHFDITSRQPSGKWGIQDAYAYAWEAWHNESQENLIAVARSHHLAAIGEKVLLSGTKSFGAIVHYEWTFTDGTKAEGSTVERTYTKPGTYSEILKVTNARGAAAYDFAVVQVQDPAQTNRLAPSIHAAFAPTTNLRVGTPVTFKVRSFRTTYGEETWDFADGTPPVTVKSDGNVKMLAPDGYAVTQHTFTNPGHYLVRVQRTNERDETAIAHLSVEISP